jgi:hypothetical protein
MCDFRGGARAGDEGGEEGLPEFVVLNSGAIGGVPDEEEGFLVRGDLFTDGMSNGSSAGERNEAIVRWKMKTTYLNSPPSPKSFA